MNHALSSTTGSPSWNQLLDRKRNMGTAPNTKDSAAFSEEAIRFPLSYYPCNDSVHRGDSCQADMRSSEKRADDPLQRVSVHRRSSFQKSVLLRGMVNQKETLELLHEAARKRQNRQDRWKRAEAACGWAVSHQQTQRRETAAVIQIQAAYRCYYCQQHHTLSAFLRPGKNRHLRRLCSELTMSEFGDSSSSLGSLDWSPRRSDSSCGTISNEKAGFHMSTATPETFLGSEFSGDNLHDSFSTIFTQYSFDLQAFPPVRKLSPTPPSTRGGLPSPNFRKGRLNSADLYLPPRSPPMMLDVRQRLHSLDSNLSPPTTTPCLVPKRICASQPTSPPTRFLSEEMGGSASSFSSLQSKDEPIKLPERRGFLVC